MTPLFPSIAWRSLHYTWRRITFSSTLFNHSKFNIGHQPPTYRLYAFRRHGSVALASRSLDETSHHKGLRVSLDLHSEQLIDEHREALKKVHIAVKSVPQVSKRDLTLLQSEISRLGDGFFMLVVAGEYNSGKSSLVNALLGRNVLAEGPTPTTSSVTKLKYSHVSTEPTIDDLGVLVRGEPVHVLSNRLQIVDTPGTNAIDRSHEALTREFLPLCDMVLFVTSADRPFSESERLFLEGIRKWGKKVVLIVNKMDLIESEASKNEVTSFVSSSALSLLGKEAKVFALSARMAKQAKDSSAGTTGQIWNESGFAPLENFINETLDSIERLRLKLRASSSVGKTITEKYLSVLSANLAIVKSDLLAVQDIQRILKRHESIVRKAYPAHLACVDNVLMGVTERAGIFFDTNVRLSNILNLSNKEVIEQSFEEEVLKGTSKSLQRQIQGVADWLADMSSKCLTESTAVFSRRVGERAKEVAGLHSDGNLDISISSLGSYGFPTGMENDVSGGRGRLAARLADVGEELSGEYISQKEGKRISDKITASVRLSAGLGIGSIASLAAFLMNSSSFSPAILLGDPTIPLLVSIVIGSGAAVIPRQRRALKCELKARIDSVRRRLQSELRGRLEQQLTSHVSGIRETIQPFSDACDEQRQDLHVQMSSLSECLEMVCKLEENMQKAEICVVDKT